MSVNNDTIQGMVAAAVQGDALAVKDAFNDLMTDKVANRIELAREYVASNLMSGDDAEAEDDADTNTDTDEVDVDEVDTDEDEEDGETA